MDKIKTIQARLKRQDLNLSREEIRSAIAGLFPDDEIDVDIATQHILSRPAHRSQSALEKVEKAEISQEQQVREIAQQINIDLPVEAIKSIAASIEWATSSRKELHGQLVSAIRDWANHKIANLRETDKRLNQQTEELFDEVSRELGNAIAQSNRQFEEKAEKLTNSVNNSVERFRKQQSEVLEFFKV